MGSIRLFAVIASIFLLGASSHVQEWDTSKSSAWIAFKEKQGWVYLSDAFLPPLWIANERAICWASGQSQRTGVFMHPFIDNFFILACHPEEQLDPRKALLFCDAHGLKLDGQEGTIIRCRPEGREPDADDLRT